MLSTIASPLGKNWSRLAHSCTLVGRASARGSSRIAIADRRRARPPLTMPRPAAGLCALSAPPRGAALSSPDVAPGAAIVLFARAARPGAAHSRPQPPAAARRYGRPDASVLRPVNRARDARGARAR